MTSYGTEAPVLDTYRAVVTAYSEFLTVAIHTILYERNLYPQASFIKARKYNYPVRQNRHPKVCKWIMDAVAAVEVEMLKVGWDYVIGRMFAVLGLLIHISLSTSAKFLYCPNSRNIDIFHNCAFKELQYVGLPLLFR